MYIITRCILVDALCESELITLASFIISCQLMTVLFTYGLAPRPCIHSKYVNMLKMLIIRVRNCFVFILLANVRFILTQNAALLRLHDSSSSRNSELSEEANDELAIPQ